MGFSKICKWGICCLQIWIDPATLGSALNQWVRISEELIPWPNNAQKCCWSCRALTLLWNNDSAVIGTVYDVCLYLLCECILWISSKEEIVRVVSYLSSGENGMQLRSCLQRMSGMAGLLKHPMGRQAKVFCVPSKRRAYFHWKAVKMSSEENILAKSITA